MGTPLLPEFSKRMSFNKMIVFLLCRASSKMKWIYILSFISSKYIDKSLQTKTCVKMPTFKYFIAWYNPINADYPISFLKGK